MSADERLALAFAARHPDDAARLLEREPPDDAAAVLAELPARAAAAVLRAMGPSAAAAATGHLADAALAAILEALPPAAMTAALRRTDPNRREALLALLSDDARKHLSVALGFPDNSAAAIADPFVFVLPEDISVADAQRQLKATSHAYFYIYVLTREGVLAGVLDVPELMGARPKQMLADVMRRSPVTLDALTDLATVAVHPAWRDFDALPVVERSGRLIGALRHRVVRQLQLERGTPVVDTLVRLGEMYWTGLSGILTSIAPAPRAGKETDVT